MQPTRRNATRYLALLVAVLGLFCGTTESQAASDGVVTYTSGGKSHVADEAQEWLRDYGDTAHERWKQGGSKLYPPETWRTDTNHAANKAAKVDAKRFGSKFGQVISKGALRAVPWIAAGLTVYSICDMVHDGCFLFKRDEAVPFPGCLQAADGSPFFVCRQQSPVPQRVEVGGVDYGHFWLYTPQGVNGLVPVGTRLCDSWPFPLIATEPFPYNQNNTVCEDGEPFYPAFYGWYGDSADFGDMASASDLANADNTRTVTVPNYLDEAATDDLAEWLDRPENQRTRQHIASEIDPDVPDPYIDGTRVPQPRTSETYEQYGDRLRAAGLLGTLRFSNEYHPAPAGTKPGRVFEVSPDGGTKIDVGSTVTYRAAPMDGTGTEPGTGSDPAPGATPENPSHTQIGTPPPSGSAACVGTFPTPNLTPLAVSFTDKWPFGFIGWFGRVMDDLNTTGQAPRVALPEVGGHAWTLDLSNFDGEAAIARSALGWAGSLFIVAWITQVALNRRITHSEKD